jgi:hypothetical protein
MIRVTKKSGCHQPHLGIISKAIAGLIKNFKIQKIIPVCKVAAKTRLNIKTGP